MTAVRAPQFSWKSIDGLQWCRNGRYPDAHFQQAIAEELNHLGAWRMKQIAGFGQMIASVPAGASSRTRWRFHFHTSPFARFLVSEMVLAPVANTLPASPGAQVQITTAPMTTVAGEYRYGAISGHAVDTPGTLGYGGAIVASSGTAFEVTPDTTYYGEFGDLDMGRLVSANLFEWSLEPTTENGYLASSYALGTAIYDEDRGDAATLARLLWKRGAGPLWHWASDLDSSSPTRTSTTGINLIDNTSTTVTAATPGATLDLTYRSTIGRGTVPCRFAAYGSCTTASQGAVDLLDSTGAVLATVTGFATTDGWLTTTVNLPATVAKYDVRHRSLNGLATQTTRAFSLYQYL